MEEDKKIDFDMKNRTFVNLIRLIEALISTDEENTEEPARALVGMIKTVNTNFVKGDREKLHVVYYMLLVYGRDFLLRHVRFLSYAKEVQTGFIDSMVGPVAELVAASIVEPGNIPVAIFPPEEAFPKPVSEKTTAAQIAFIRDNILKTEAFFRATQNATDPTDRLLPLCATVRDLFRVAEEPRKNVTFPIPSNYDIWNPLLFLFTAGKSPLYFRAFQKEPADRSVEEQAEIDALIDSVFAIDTDYGGNQAVSQISFDDPRGLCELLAVPQKGAALFLNDERFTRETLYIQVQKELMSESGLRHFLALLLSFYRNQGRFTWRVNDHLKMLGCQKKNNGDYSPRDVESAKNTINMFTKILFTVPDRLHPEKSRTFPLAVIEEIDHATDWSQIDGVSLIAPKWYQEAMNGSGSKGAQYTLLLEKLLREKNTTNRPNAAVVLSVRFSLLWRIHGKELRMKLSTLLNFLEPASKRTRPKKQLLNLQTTLNYLVERAYMGSWVLDSGLSLEDVTDPDKEYVTLYPPEWLNKNISTLQASREAVKAVKKPIPPASKDRVKNIIDQLLQKGYTQHNIAQSIGVSQTSINLWKRGARKISPENYIKLLDLLENQA